MAKDIQVHLTNETIAELDPPPGLRVTTNTSVAETIELMQTNRTGCALVCNNRQLVGIFTEQDYLRRVLSKGKDRSAPISEFMTRDPATVRVSDSIATLVRRFHEGRYRRLPIVDERNEIVGCVSVRNLVHHLAEHFPGAVYNLAPVSKPTQSDREGA